MLDKYNYGHQNDYQFILTSYTSSGVYGGLEKVSKMKVLNKEKPLETIVFIYKMVMVKTMQQNKKKSHEI